MSHASELSQWQQQIQAGNDCFNEHQTLSALSHYNLAKVHAESMLAHFEDTKAAVEAFSKTIPMKRVAQSEEVSNMVLFLASDDASYSTGSEFLVDGGLTAQ